MIETAQQAARAAGEILLQHFGRVSKDVIREKSATDFISFVDEASEKKIISVIREHFTDHAVLAEESGVSAGETPYQWIIDPLDGTTNYLQGIPVFAVSIALKHQQEIIAGVIYDPLRDEMFRAEKDKGAFLNDQPIEVSARKSINESFIATGFPFKTKHILAGYLRAFHDLFKDCIGMRRMGAAAIDLAYVAAGRFDGFWEVGLKPWDVAAGSLIVTEAGGQVSDFWGRPHFMHNSYIIASNQKIHGQLAESLQKHFPFYKPVDEKGAIRDTF